MTKNLLDLKNQLSQFYKLTGIPVECYETMGSQQADIPLFSFPERFFHPSPARLLLNGLESSHVPSAYTLSREFLCFGFLKLSYSNMMVVLGPVTESDFSLEQARQTLEQIGESTGRGRELLNWLQPFCQISKARLCSALSYLDFLCNERVDQTPLFLPSFSPEELAAGANMDMLLHPLSAESSDELMNRIMHLICYGKTEEIRKWLSTLPATDNSLPDWNAGMQRNFRNILVYSTVLAANAAQKGGLDRRSAEVLTHHYLSQIEHKNSFQELSSMFGEIMLRFTREVAQLPFPSDCPPLIRKVCQYVCGHVTEKLSLSLLAELVHKSPEHLSRTFREYMEKTVTCFIQEQKIREACYLLEQTSDSLAKIAADLSFPSQSYFQRVFRRVTGTTPAAYRGQSR